jgi:hypothetical protein
MVPQLLSRPLPHALGVHSSWHIHKPQTLDFPQERVTGSPQSTTGQQKLSEAR